MAAGPCPTPAALEAYSAESKPDPALRRHVDACPACRAALMDILENNRFLDGVRSALPRTANTSDDAPIATPGTEPADIVPGYTLLEEIHRGGQGIVYRAVQKQTQRFVAIKMLLGGVHATGRQRERFEREARIAAALRHPNIVTIYDSGYLADGRFAFAMEYVEGVPLDAWSRGLDQRTGRDAPRRALRERMTVMAKVCDAVLCAHQHAIIHRDLKPANILIDARGEPHVLDFGIAKRSEPRGPDHATIITDPMIEPSRLQLTSPGEFAGTLAYAAPEQVTGDPSRIDTRTDIYALGVVMYELVGGRMPYDVEGPLGRVIRNIESAAPAPLADSASGPGGRRVDTDTATIILKAMSKDPVRRYQTAAGLKQDIERSLSGGTIEARRDSTWYVIRKTASRHLVAFSTAGAILILLAAFGVSTWWQAHRLAARTLELEAALEAATFEQATNLSESGFIARSEDIVWPRLLGAGVGADDIPDAGFAGSPEAMQAYWGLWYVYSRAPCLATLETDGRPVSLLYFDDDGRRLTAFTKGGSLASWSFPDLKPLRLQQLFTDAYVEARSAALRPDRRAIAVLGGDAVRVIDTETGTELARRPDPDGQFLTGTFSPDGSLLAAIGRDDRLRLWDARTLELRTTIPDEVPCRVIPSLASEPAISPDGSLVAAGRQDGSIGFWSTSSGALVRSRRPPESVRGLVGVGLFPHVVTFSPDGSRIAAAINTHTLIWNSDGDDPPLDVHVHEASVRSLAFGGKDASLLVSTSTDAYVAVFNASNGARLDSFGSYEGAAVNALPSAAGDLLVAGYASGKVRVFEIAHDPHRTVLASGSGFGTAVTVSRNGRTAAFAAGPGGEEGQDILLIDLEKPFNRRVLLRCRTQVTSLDFSPDDVFLYAGESGDRIVQCDATSGNIERVFVTPPEAYRAPPDTRPADRGLAPRTNVHGTCLSPDGRLLARGCSDGLIQLWDARTGAWLGRLDRGESSVYVVAFSPDSRTLASLDSFGVCTLWDAAERRERLTFETGEPRRTLAFSYDGATLATGGRGGILRVWDAATGIDRHDTGWEDQAGQGAAFHPGGPVLFSGAADGNIRLWDSRNGRRLIPLRGHRDTIVSLYPTPDGRTLISCDVSGTLIMWDLTHFAPHIARHLPARLHAVAARQ